MAQRHAVKQQLLEVLFLTKPLNYWYKLLSTTIIQKTQNKQAVTFLIISSYSFIFLLWTNKIQSWTLSYKLIQFYIKYGCKMVSKEASDTSWWNTSIYKFTQSHTRSFFEMVTEIQTTAIRQQIGFQCWASDKISALRHRFEVTHTLTQTA